MGGIAGESEYYETARRFQEGSLTEIEARKEIENLERFHQVQPVFTSWFNALVMNLRYSPVALFQGEARASENVQYLYQPLSRHQLQLFHDFRSMLVYGLNEADSLLGFRLFHEGGGERTGIPKMTSERMARLSALVEAPIYLVYSKGDIPVRDELNFAPSTPWYDFATISELSAYKDASLSSFTTGKVVIPKLAIIAGLSFVRIPGFTQFSLTHADGMSTWLVNWARVLIDLAQECVPIFRFPAVFTSASEFLSNIRIFRLSWAADLPVGMDLNKFYVRLYSRLLTPRTHLATFYGSYGNVIEEIENPSSHRSNIVEHVRRLPFY